MRHVHPLDSADATAASISLLGCLGLFVILSSLLTNVNASLFSHMEGDSPDQNEVQHMTRKPEEKTWLRVGTAQDRVAPPNPVPIRSASNTTATFWARPENIYPLAA
jgi:hypothetical protein